MLTVHISSFSYLATGIPPDSWGHGGGFTFDCRCLPNPGRLKEYGAVTGRDESVVKWLEQHPVVSEFLLAAATVVELAVREYQDRQLEHLSVAFGCTGGQHRSIYCAEWLAVRLKEQGIGVTLEHVQHP